MTVGKPIAAVAAVVLRRKVLRVFVVLMRFCSLAGVSAARLLRADTGDANINLSSKFVTLLTKVRMFK
jgi:hypothetical protein